MKRLLWFLVLTLSFTILVSCNDKTEPQNNEDKIDLGGIDFVIMVDIPGRQDPRDTLYERMYQTEKAEKIAEVETKYNVKVVYKPYTVSWGLDRRNWIKNQNLVDAKDVHVFEVNTSWIPYLAHFGVISDLKPYIDKYVDKEKEYFIEKEDYTKFKGGIYGYDDMLNMAECGIYYNMELLAEILGEENKNLPSRMWLEGNWNWVTFKALVDEIYQWTKDKDENYHVIGGMGYNWAYQMAAANGLSLIDNDFQIQFVNEEMIKTLEYLRNLYHRSDVGKNIVWKTTKNWSLTAIPEFSQGNVVFHDGESWYLTMQNRWLRTEENRNFDIGFVPFPTGPNTKADLSNYYISAVNGQATYVISSAFEKNRIPEGYENMFIHDEIIFKIWKDLQYFSPVGRESYANQFLTKRAIAQYGDPVSVEAHRSILNKLNVEYFYYVEGNDNHEDGSAMGKLGLAVTEVDLNPRSAMESLAQFVASRIYDQFEIEQK